MPTAGTFPPSMGDWADGSPNNAGTATPASAFFIKAPDGSISSYIFEEAPDSPEIERGDQCTVRHTFNVNYTYGLVFIQGIGRGSYFIDSAGNISRVLTCKLTKKKGNMAELQITCESISFDGPPDEYGVERVEINPEVEKHPRYVRITGNGVGVLPYNVNINGGTINGNILTGPSIVRICKDAAASVTMGMGNELLSRLNSTLIPDATVLALAQSLYRRYLKGEETFYLAGLHVRWTQYYWQPFQLNPGGYIEDPVSSGHLPAFFWSDTGEPGGNNTLLKAAQTINPLAYANGISWLRFADSVEYQRTWFKVTRTWHGGPLGTWDPVLYPKFDGNGNEVTYPG